MKISKKEGKNKDTKVLLGNFFLTRYKILCARDVEIFCYLERFQG
jgi:hypothetical protein